MYDDKEELFSAINIMDDDNQFQLSPQGVYVCIHLYILCKYI
jgi:hypothetical protein